VTRDESIGMPNQKNVFVSGRSANVLKALGRALECFQMYLRPLGIPGVAAILSHRLCGRPKELAVRSADSGHTIHLRLRTSDVSCYEEVLLHRQYSFDLPFSPKIIVDAGANIGMASIYYANKYPDARVIALEPEASNFAVLVRNARPYPNVCCIRAALWNRDGQIAVSSPSLAQGAPGNMGFIVHEGQGAPVRALTLQTLMRDTDIESIDILKVDIEGAEKEVFECCSWMQHVRSLAIELHDRFKSGCSATVNSVTGDFLATQRGETTFYVRKSCLEAHGESESFQRRA
jgi:FkbM family methyltransferase